jgi:hypothetical protein
VEKLEGEKLGEVRRLIWRAVANRGWQSPAIHNRVRRRLKLGYISFIED